MIALWVALSLAAAPARLVKPRSIGWTSTTSVRIDFETNSGCAGFAAIKELPASATSIATDPRTGHCVSTFAQLRPGATYHYALQFGDLLASGAFETPPVHGAFTFAVVGDARDHEKWAELSRAILAKHPRFMLTTGDSIVGGNSVDAWRDYYVAAQELFANTPVFAVMGNHDLGSNYAEYNPAPSTGIGPSTYAFTYGNAGFIAIDSNSADDPAQKAFVQRALSAMRGGPLFVFQHHPLHSCGPHGDSESMKSTYAALFEKAHVTVDFAGHDHDLIDYPPINGVRYVVSGGGGTVTYPLSGCDASDFAKSSYGFVMVSVAGAKVAMTFYDEHGIELRAVGPFQAAGPSVPAVDLTKLASH